MDPEQKTVLTSRGQTLRYDTLVIATGAVRLPAVPGALTFSERRDIAPLQRLLGEVEQGRVTKIGFVVPSGAGWPLPIYELASTDLGVGGETWSGQCGNHAGNTGVGTACPLRRGRKYECQGTARPTPHNVRSVQLPRSFRGGRARTCAVSSSYAGSGCRSSPDRGTADCRTSLRSPRLHSDRSPWVGLGSIRRLRGRRRDDVSDQAGGYRGTAGRRGRPEDCRPRGGYCRG